MNWKFVGVMLVIVSVIFYAAYAGEQKKQQAIKLQQMINKPITDWGKFHEALHAAEESEVILRIGVSQKDECHVFLVDDDCWYYITSQQFREPVQNVKLEFLRLRLKTIPSNDAKIVVVGPSTPKLTCVEFIYNK